LRDLERRAVGTQVAERSGQAFVERTPDGFRGRVQMEEGPTGVSYTIISDGLRFAVLETTASLRAIRAPSSQTGPA
jgi:hypothetical protein